MDTEQYVENIQSVSCKAAEDSDARFRIELTPKLLVVSEQACMPLVGLKSLKQ